MNMIINCWFCNEEMNGDSNISNSLIICNNKKCMIFGTIRKFDISFYEYSINKLYYRRSVTSEDWEVFAIHPNSVEQHFYSNNKRFDKKIIRQLNIKSDLNQMSADSILKIVEKFDKLNLFT